MGLGTILENRPHRFTFLIILQFTVGFLWLIGIIAAALFAFPFSPGYEGNSLEIGDMFGMVVGTLFLLGGISVALISSIGLLQRKRWWRTASIVNSTLSLIIVPIGTIIGILALSFLLKTE